MSSYNLASNPTNRPVVYSAECGGAAFSNGLPPEEVEWKQKAVSTKAAAPNTPPEKNQHFISPSPHLSPSPLSRPLHRNQSASPTPPLTTSNFTSKRRPAPPPLTPELLTEVVDNDTAAQPVADVHARAVAENAMPLPKVMTLQQQQHQQQCQQYHQQQQQRRQQQHQHHHELQQQYHQRQQQQQQYQRYGRPVNSQLSLPHQPPTYAGTATGGRSGAAVLRLLPLQRDETRNADDHRSGQQRRLGAPSSDAPGAALNMQGRRLGSCRVSQNGIPFIPAAPTEMAAQHPLQQSSMSSMSSLYDLDATYAQPVSMNPLLSFVYPAPQQQQQQQQLSHASFCQVAPFHGHTFDYFNGSSTAQSLHWSYSSTGGQMDPYTGQQQQQQQQQQIPNRSVSVASASLTVDLFHTVPVTQSIQPPLLYGHPAVQNSTTSSATPWPFTSTFYDDQATKDLHWSTNHDMEPFSDAPQRPSRGNTQPSQRLSHTTTATTHSTCNNSTSTFSGAAVGATGEDFYPLFSAIEEVNPLVQVIGLDSGSQRASFRRATQSLSSVGHRISAHLKYFSGVRRQRRNGVTAEDSVLMEQSNSTAASSSVSSSDTSGRISSGKPRSGAAQSKKWKASKLKMTNNDEGAGGITTRHQSSTSFSDMQSKQSSGSIAERRRIPVKSLNVQLLLVPTK